MRNEKWMVSMKKADFTGLGAEFGLDPLAIRLMRNRDVFTQEDEKRVCNGESDAERKIHRFLQGGLQELYNPSDMKDLPESASLIKEAIEAGRRIRIIGDYDIDGVMSTYILLKGFQLAGADPERVDYRIPERIRDGYGLNENLIREAISDGVELIVTCDNGIAAYSQVKMAKDAGISVIVTDHHQVPFKEREDGGRDYILPPADAVVDPHRADETYPFDGLCGAGVAFKLICLLLDGREGVPDAQNLADKESLLQFTAVATVGDVMDLTDENRILVREGLKRLHHTSNYGLQELILQNGLEPEQVDVYHLGFVLGPCINASGRLETADAAMRMLLAEDRNEAAKLAGDLIALNASRKDMTAKGAEQAIEMVETTDLKNDRVLVVYMPDCHESLAGIIAGRLREHYNRPSFVITGSGDRAKGSGRSIETYSMYEELCKCGDFLTQFGGHPMAAGLSLPESNIEGFRQRINEVCTLTEDDLTPKITADAQVPLSYISRKLIEDMEKLGPFGKGNARPVFAERNLAASGLRVFGKNRNVAKMKLTDQRGFSMDAVYFGDGDEFVRYVRDRGTISVMYYPKLDTWQGRENLQVVVTSYR